MENLEELSSNEELSEPVENNEEYTKWRLAVDILSVGWELTKYVVIPGTIGYYIASAISPELGLMGVLFGVSVGVNAQDKAYGEFGDGDVFHPGFF
jgi:hypothetical protein